MTALPLRTLLFLPASNPRAIEKARSLPCDAVVLDLEDAVGPEDKDAARLAMGSALAAGGFGGRRLVVRVNGLDTPWGAADLAAIAALDAASAPGAVLLPKVGCAADVSAAHAALAGTPPLVALWAMIETCRGVVELPAIAAETGRTRLDALVAGVNDLAKDMRCRPGPLRTPLLPALAMIVTAARAHGLQAFDGVFNALDDEAGLRAECEQGRGLGFEGKCLIHPAQIAVATELFSPSPAEVAWARRVVSAFAADANIGKGAIRLDGKMVERLHLIEAERLLAEV